MLFVDQFICNADKFLRVVSGLSSAGRTNPAAGLPDVELDAAQRRHAAGLMRVNHVGEVCAQALYEAQGRFAKSDALKVQFAQAGREEEDHLAWTAQRLGELGAGPSLFNPLWYAGAFALGAVAAKIGNAASLGFVVETERQVEAHLEGHLSTLPAEDAKSRAIVDQMRIDEIAHGAAARDLGAAEVPAPVKKLMQGMARVMTSTAYYI